MTPKGSANRRYPKAYLNWIFLDDQFNYVSSLSGSVLAASSTYPAGSLNLVAPGGGAIALNRSGYLYIWVSNETTGWDVYYDNLSIQYKQGPLLEENHYYPFGLTMAGISDKAIKSNYAENKNRYNDGAELQSKEFNDGTGLEYYDAGFRQLDPQLGRFNQVDPFADTYDYLSTYQYGANNPVYYNDPLGLEAKAPNNTDFWNAVLYNAEQTISDPTDPGASFKVNQNGSFAWNDFSDQMDAFTTAASDAYLSGYWGTGQDAANGFNAAQQAYANLTGVNPGLSLPVVDIGYYNNGGNWVTTNGSNLQSQLQANGAIGTSGWDIAGTVNDYVFGALGAFGNGTMNRSFVAAAALSGQLEGNLSDETLSTLGKLGNFAKYGEAASYGGFAIGVGIDIARVTDSYNREGGFGPATQKVTASAVTSLAGGYSGTEIGAAVGGAIGSLFGGVGAVPGAIIGGFIGGIIGSWGGEKIGEALW